MENSFKYFCNDKCRYYPCHSGAEGASGFNCLFCYCPLYPYADCPGTFEMKTGKNGNKVKNCTDCLWPHVPEHYSDLIRFLVEKNNENT